MFVLNENRNEYACSIIYGYLSTFERRDHRTTIHIDI